MAREPKAKNSHRCPPKLWRSMNEFERHLYNKFLNFAVYHPEHFTDTKIEDWEKICRKMAVIVINTHKRGRQATYS